MSQWIADRRLRVAYSRAMVETSSDETQGEVRRSLSVVGPDGVKYSILAAKQGVPFRAEALDGSAAGGSIIGSIVGWIIFSIVGAIVEIRAADKASWKLGVVRQRGFPQRIKQKEFLPSGVDPTERMAEIAAQISSRTVH